MLRTCPVCGGEYETVQKGEIYQHACPPALDKIVVDRVGVTVAVDPAKLLPGDKELDRRYVERPNKVDETILTKR